MASLNDAVDGRTWPESSEPEVCLPSAAFLLHLSTPELRCSCEFDLTGHAATDMGLVL